MVNRAKLEVLKMWEEIHGDRSLYQLAAEELGRENAGVHPLYMGIRYANALWKLEPYPTEKAVAELKTLIEEPKGMWKESQEPPAQKTEKIEKISANKTASRRQAAAK